MKDLNLFVTLSPSMPHFSQFAYDRSLSGIRINSAMMYADELDGELDIARKAMAKGSNLFFDIKGRQLRIKEVIPKRNHVEIILNHRIHVDTPTVVLFKAGEDHAVLESVEDDGSRLVFEPHAPHFNLKPGESICIRDNSFEILDKAFPDYEIERIKKVVNSGFTKYVLSYVESQRDVDEFRSYVGKDAFVILKIENKRGLNYVAKEFKQQENTALMAARGDLYIEVDKPHHILQAMKLIIKQDPGAYLGSRLLLSCVEKEIPDAADFSELAWLYDIGYRNMMLCDDLCIEAARLRRAVTVFNVFRDSYAKEILSPSKIIHASPASPANTNLGWKAWVQKCWDSI